jgi:molybdopterin molybdotransferase
MAGKPMMNFDNFKHLTDLVNLQEPCDDYDPNSMSVEDARIFIQRFLTPLKDFETISIQEALGRILSKEIIAPHNVPNHDNSAMDGYAVRSADLNPNGETRLKLCGESFAGHAPTNHLIKDGCIKIMTGAQIPEGADAVIPVEQTLYEDNTIIIKKPLKAGANIRYAGEDLQQNQVVLPQGRRITPADMGLIASLGIGQVQVYRRLKVCFFSTGDELVSIGESLASGKIYDSNRYTLRGMLSRLEVDFCDLGAIPDDLELLEETLLKASQESDVIITSGGVSVGEADYMKMLLKKHGEILFWKIAMKPGRPLAYGKVGQAHFFGLPGNPVAVMVTFYQFVKEALQCLMGQSVQPIAPLFKVSLVGHIKKAKGRTEYQRGILFQNKTGEWAVKTTGNQNSGVLRSMSEANCFIVLAEDCGDLSEGDWVKVQLFEGLT